MAVLKLSQIASSPANAIAADTFIGVHGGNTDYQFTGTQLGAGLPITINTTPISGGTSGRLLYDNAGAVGEADSVTWNGSNSLDIFSPASFGQISMSGAGDGSQWSNFTLGNDTFDQFWTASMRVSDIGGNSFLLFNFDGSNFNNALSISLDLTRFSLPSTTVFGWASTANSGGTVDTTLRRSGAATIQTDNLSLTSTSTLSIGATQLAPDVADKAITCNQEIRMIDPPAGAVSLYGCNHTNPVDRCVAFDCPTDSFNRFTIDGNGGMTWGPGSTAADLGIVRLGVGVLSINGSFNVPTGQAYLYNSLNALYSVPNGSGDNWFAAGAGNQSVSGSGNFGLGQSCLGATTSATNNVGVGSFAMQNVVASGTDNNTGVGFAALATLGQSGGSGLYNVAIGTNAGQAVNGGNTNTLLGAVAGNAISTGSDNVVIGSFHFASVVTGGTITTGSQNIVIGSGCDVPSASADGQLSIGNFVYGTGLTGTGSTVSSGAIGIGIKAPGYNLDVSSTAGGSTHGLAIGVDSIQGIVRIQTAGGDSWFLAGSGNFTLTGQSNFGMGANNLSSLTTGTANSAFASGALQHLTSGQSNVAFGITAANALVDGVTCTAVGYSSLVTSQHDSNNTAIGANALNTVNGGGNNTGVGFAAGYSITVGTDNTIIGNQGFNLGTVTTGSQNIVIGSNCDISSASANGQLSIGNFLYGTGLTGTGSTVSTGKIGIGIKAPGTELDINGVYGINGVNALFSVPNAGGDNWFMAGGGNLTVSANQNFGIGASALAAVSSGARNTAIGSIAGQAINTGVDTVAIGSAALSSATSDQYAVCIGSSAGALLNGSVLNTMLGYGAGHVCVTGNTNTIIGSLAGNSLLGSDNTIIGGWYQFSLPCGNTITTGSQNIVIGSGCDVPSASANGQLSIGNYIYGTGLTGTGSTVSGGWLGVGKTTAFGSEALGVVGGITVSGDPGGVASSNTVSGVSSTTISTGVGVIHMSSANPGTNTGWLKCYIGTQVAWVPCWTTNAP